MLASYASVSVEQRQFAAVCSVAPFSSCEQQTPDMSHFVETDVSRQSEPSDSGTEPELDPELDPESRQFSSHTNTEAAGLSACFSSSFSMSDVTSSFV